ncbi:MAG: hypothetical protein H0Z39_10995 [Peptococcaceae bacterium]|nr:hypothetical protein [Peptococcaceae bacterium]
MDFSTFLSIFWLLILASALLPMMKQRQIEKARIKLIRKIEKERGSRLITLIHRQELLSLLGFPLTRYINIEDSEHILRAIRLTPDNLPIDLVLHTPGGLVLASEQIARALLKHPAKVTVFVPHYAMSGGTMIALAADEIVMDENAVLGPVDPQLGNFPAASILEAVREKGKKDVNDKTLIMADISVKAMHQVKEFVYDLLVAKMDPQKARTLAEAFSSGQWTHDFPITVERLADLDIPVTTDVPSDIYKLMNLYPQPAQRRPSVQFIPVPYGEQDRERKEK